MRYKTTSTTAVINILTILLFFACTPTPPPPPNPVDPLEITSIIPASGSILSLDTINGKGFSLNLTQNQVFYNDQPAEVLTASNTQLIVRVPASATTGPVSVKVNAKQVQGPVFTVTSNVTITSITPNSGYAGTIVTIYGTGFNADKAEDTVWIGNVKAPILTASPSTLTVTAPLNGSTGRVAVAVKKDIALGPVFTYLNAPATDSVIVTTFSGSGAIDSADGPGSSAGFGFIWDIDVDNLGNVYVADAGWNRIRKISPAGVVSTLAGKGSRLASYGRGTFFYDPITVTVDNSNGKVYVFDRELSPVKVITAPETVFTLAINYYLQPYYTQYDIISDNNGNIYLAHSNSNAIYKITSSGTVSVVAGWLLGDVDGTGSAARFSVPSAIAVDHRNGNLYVADGGNNKIRKITPEGVVTTIAGKGNGSGGFVDGPVAIATFGVPSGIAVDDKGNVFVSDHNKIRKITPDGYVTTIAGTGAEGLKNGPGNTATFKDPMGLAFDGEGNLYVADGSNHVIRKIVFKH